MSTVTAVSSLEIVAAQEVAATVRQLRKSLQDILSDHAAVSSAGSEVPSEQLSQLALRELRLILDRPERAGLDGLGLGCTDRS